MVKVQDLIQNQNLTQNLIHITKAMMNRKVMTKVMTNREVTIKGGGSMINHQINMIKDMATVQTDMAMVADTMINMSMAMVVLVNGTEAHDLEVEKVGAKIKKEVYNLYF